MPVGFFRNVGTDGDLRDALLVALRRGPFDGHDLADWVGERLEREGLRTSNIQPILLKLGDRGLVAISKQGSGRLYSLTLIGHDVAEGIAEGEAFEDAAGPYQVRRPHRSLNDDLDDNARRRVARIVSSAFEREGRTAGDEIRRAAGGA